MTKVHPGTSLRGGRGIVLEPPGGIVLPPERMPMFYRRRLRKQWLYVAVWSPRVLLSVCSIGVGPFSQAFWALWDGETLRQQTRRGRGLVDLNDMRVRFRDGRVSVDLTLDEEDAFQVLNFDDRAYTWTGKQLVRATGSIRVEGVSYEIDAPGLVDESAGYHPRHTRYKWSAGAGTDMQGRSVAWNLAEGINDAAINSERTVWVDAVPNEVGPVSIDESLAGITFAEGSRLDFRPEAVRETHDNLLVIRSNYRHPFGTFSGTLPGGIQLRDARGVMENHDVFW
ncbi:MAG: DUF2804 family protein [Acidobacteriota bacterium]